jgi:hypothetical protein
MVASYRIFSDREILCFLAIERARDQDAIERAAHMRDVDEVEIEVWERAPLVGWLAVPVLHRTMDAWRKPLD